MKKPKKKTIWVVKNKIFTTFKAFKTFSWYNMIPGECTNGFEIFEDTIIKEYNINRKERRLIIEKIYDEQEEISKNVLNQQLKLW
jgi:hypothetical protein